MGLRRRGRDRRVPDGSQAGAAFRPESVSCDVARRSLAVEAKGKDVGFDNKFVKGTALVGDASNCSGGLVVYLGKAALPGKGVDFRDALQCHARLLATCEPTHVQGPLVPQLPGQHPLSYRT